MHKILSIKGSYEKWKLLWTCGPQNYLTTGYLQLVTSNVGRSTSFSFSHCHNSSEILHISCLYSIRYLLTKHDQVIIIKHSVILYTVTV